MRKFILFVLILIIVSAVVLYTQRRTVMRRSTEYALKKVLPGYVTLDELKFDFANKRLAGHGLAILNAEGFSKVNILEISKLSCKFKKKGAKILDGLEITDLTMRGVLFIIERRRDGKLNILEIEKTLKAPKATRQAAGPFIGPSLAEASPEAPETSRKFADYVKLPDKLSIKEGKLIFIDNALRANPYIITVDNINATVGLKLDEDYSDILFMNTNGRGILNAKNDQKLEWIVSLNPTTPKLSMANRFIVKGVDLLTFVPYIDRYSPLNIRKGLFSGTLVIDFDNGQIGSTNEVELSGLDFSVKSGYEKAQFWQTTVSDLRQYLLSGSGTIIFDFKIKGQPDNLKFFLGPITKKAMTRMVIDRVSQAIVSPSEGKEGSQELPGDLKKIKDIVDMLKNMKR